MGVAPGADLILVHLANRGTAGLASLSDSVGILEGLEFARSVAGSRPLVCSMSVGRHAGSHDSTGLVNLGILEFLAQRPGLALAQSAGNYGLKLCHASGVLLPGGSS